MEFSGINLLSLIFRARSPELIRMVVRFCASNYLTSHLKRPRNHGTYFKHLLSLPLPCLLCLFSFQEREKKGFHRVLHISPLAYPMEPNDEKEGRTMPVGLQSLATNCPESKSPPKRGPGLSPIPGIDPKDCNCSPSPIKALAMVPSSRIPLP